MDTNEAVLAYEARGVRVSRTAVGVFCLSIVAAVGFFLVVPAAVVWIAALIVRAWVGRRPDMGGYGYASAAVTVSGCSAVLGVLVLILMPSLGREHRGSSRGRCAANVRGIAQSMHVYGADNNDVYPLVNYAPYTPAFNDARASAGGTTPEDTYKSIYQRSGSAGSVQACLWILCIRGDVAPKQFLCGDDPFANTAGQLLNTAGAYFTNFQDGKQLSYSIAYPWKADGTPGGWWKAASDASVPLLADMAPKQGTGTPARNVTPTSVPTDNRTWNSSNHHGDGQNVSFGDAHAEFVRTPTVGQDNDNIYSMSGSPSTRGAQFGGMPAGNSAPQLTAEKTPFDTVMLPVRDETTGGM